MGSDQDTPTTSPNTDAARPGRLRRFFRAIGRIVLWTIIIVIGWWALSSFIPGMPTPMHGAKALFGLVKGVSDEVYFAANKDALKKAEKDVLASAEETGTQPENVRSDIDTISSERRKRLPAVSLREDSVLRTEMKNISSKPFIGGRLINIVLIGIDSRLSVRNARADAIHLFTINPDSAVVEIMSIPRDTYCDLGYPDTTSFNIMANARALGYEGFMRRVGELTKRGTVRYYIEVGFSQAMGVLEILGYKDPVSTLKFLRTRKSLPAGDVQRSHNQATFLRQNLISKFSLLTGATGDLLLSAGLNFVTTNLTKDYCKGLIYALQQRSFPANRSDAVRLRMLPIYKIRLKEMSADSSTVAQTLQRNKRILGDDETPVVNVPDYLRRANRKAIEDSARPGQVVHRLQRLADQHAWVQIQDLRTRSGIRDTLLNLLERAYRKLGQNDHAEQVVANRRSEDILLQQKRN
jgi:anionic cell wall polymer biosynthesis LytR-Cps2A-Psr (LCP) family protein